MSPRHRRSIFARPRWCSLGFPYSAPGFRWGHPPLLVNSWQERLYVGAAGLPPKSVFTAAVCSSKTSKQLYTERFWRVGVVDLVVLACVLRDTTKKIVNFLSCPPPKYFLLEPPLIPGHAPDQETLYLGTWKEGSRQRCCIRIQPISRGRTMANIIQRNALDYLSSYTANVTRYKKL